MATGRGGTWVSDANVALLTDLYELTMAASYHRHKMIEPATFDLFVRSLPDERNFLVVCGLDEALDYLENVRFEQESIAFLRATKLFDEAFLDYLKTFRFTGDVWAMPEGEVAFGREPLLRITAPLIEAQFVETFLLNTVTFQTMIASKAARVAIACGGRSFIDFSLRRDHGADAGLKAARAAFVGGASATSNVLAGQIYGIPLSGTMAHSYVMAFRREIDAFRTYAGDFGSASILLIDTFDIVEGAYNAATVALEMKARNENLRGVRIDSGDIAACAKVVRGILDDAGLSEVQVIASGDLDEHRIRDLLGADAPIDAFGVGTQLGTSGDAPSLGAAYKLVEDHEGPKIKLSTGKATIPCRKQVLRTERSGTIRRDVIAHEHEKIEGRPLLHEVMSGGRRVLPRRTLEAQRAACLQAVAALPEALKALDRKAHYRVDLSPSLEELVRSMQGSGSAFRSTP
jgi:nicotinate phosphoribosyltransferase